jgi:hypothetical protein
MQHSLRRQRCKPNRLEILSLEALSLSRSQKNQWAWRVPIIAMQLFPLGLLAFVGELPESPRWLAGKGKQEEATEALKRFHDEDTAKKRSEELVKAAEEEADESVSYKDMLTPGHTQFHPTMLTIMGQVNQALTGYGCKCCRSGRTFEIAMLTRTLTRSFRLRTSNL